MMNESPNKKKPKLDALKTPKRRNESDDSNSKRAKTDSASEENYEKKIQTMKRRNFITACEQVSYEAYYNHQLRFKLVYLPPCLETCHHHKVKNGVEATEMPGYAEESFKIEIKTNMWCEALEVCQLCIKPNQYLSANVLKDVVEIMLNAHEDSFSSYTISGLIDECQQILEHNFAEHPPCMVKPLRQCYNKFLTSPMDLKDNTFTNRSEFGCDKGIVKYCMNRLEYELSPESKDTPLVDRNENIPEEMKQSVKGLHWQKEKFEIFELLNRKDRIDRLMAVLESTIELLQFDLAIWHSRHTSNQGRHIMRSHKPLMAYILWSDNVLYTGAVNSNCRQILRLFVQFVHLGYPESYVRIMMLWLNTIVQTFYICETNSNSDYPNIGKYCTTFAREFYKIITELPNEKIISVIEAVEPAYMLHLIGVLHIKVVLETKEDDILKIISEFVKKSRWKDFQTSDKELNIQIMHKTKAKKVKDVYKYLLKKLNNFMAEESNINDTTIITYPKLDNNVPIQESVVDINHIVHILFITLRAYLDTYSVQDVQEKIETLNENLGNQDTMEPKGNAERPDDYSYSVSEHFIKKYRNIYQMLQELSIMFNNMKSDNELPDILKVFEQVGLLSL